jgi:acetamidase/formamidase
MPRGRAAPVTHRIDPERVHHRWDRDLAPVLEIASGDAVEYELRMAGHGQIEPGAPFGADTLDQDTLYHLSGPVRVRGATPGSTLRVDVLELTPGSWGWCAVLPGLGLLPDDFPEAHLRIFDLGGRDTVEIAPGMVAPLAPFLGTMGNHPGEPAVASAFPPHRGGGNVDTRHLVAGSTLWLPVWCDGALFSCGDPPRCRATARCACRRSSATCAPCCASRSSPGASPPRPSGPPTSWGRWASTPTCTRAPASPCGR